ncbi:MAG: DUF4258 domain-containing protein [Chloroflexi bacterium]|nr:DUF4258 domain-containing protein [Chloroflexota bacterium]
MEIRINAHTLERAMERGADENEISDVLTTGVVTKAKHGRLGRAKVFAFGQARAGRFYEQKRVEVIYTVEGDTIVTITVYVFYGKWES